MGILRLQVTITISLAGTAMLGHASSTVSNNGTNGVVIAMATNNNMRVVNLPMQAMLLIPIARTMEYRRLVDDGEQPN